jgi:predicted O-methyltransferase YrrM
MESVSAAATYADGSLDFVFIDAAHDYQSVVDDIRAWGPKMKPGGTLAGHDYQREEFQRAVHDVLGSDVRISEWC